MSDKCTDCGFDLVHIGGITKVCPKCLDTRLIYAERRVKELEDALEYITERERDASSALSFQYVSACQDELGCIAKKIRSVTTLKSK